MLKKTWRFLTSMKFAILLLAVLTLACVFGSVIPQGGTLDEYLGAYGARGGALIVGLCLDDVFHNTWFLVLTVLLVCDLAAERGRASLRRSRDAGGRGSRAEARPPQAGACGLHRKAGSRRGCGF